MRTINEIIIDAKDGKIPSHEECFWTMLALSGRLHFTTDSLKSIGEAFEKTNIAQTDVEAKKADFNLRFRIRMCAKDASMIWNERLKFGNMDPQVWLGDMGNPFDPNTIKFHDAAKVILEKAMKKVKENK